MEDSKKTIDEVQAKLSELQTKLRSYQDQLLTELTEFIRDRLQDLPREIEDEVVAAIDKSMDEHPFLCDRTVTDTEREPNSEPESEPESETTSTSQTSSREGRKSPPPVLYHTSGIPKILREGLKPQHEREIEFQGLFTPSYLPLLDGNDRRIPKPLVINVPKIARDVKDEAEDEPSDEQPSGSGSGSDEAEVELVEDAEPAEDKDSDEDADKGKSKSIDKGKGREVSRPSPARGLTDVSVSSSVGSSSSEQKTRRSALRRSSSASVRGSPRRVRFEVEGAEVLPTASPPSGGFNSEAMDLGDDSEQFDVPSLIDVEGEEDDRPRPARISSTDALRRLSRTPSDDGTVWSTVNQNDPPIVPPSTNGGGLSEAAKARLAEKEATYMPSSRAMAPPGWYDDKEPQKPTPVNGSHAPQATAASGTTAPQPADEDDSEEEGFLAMKKSPKKSLSPATTPTSILAKSPLSTEVSSQIMQEEAPKPSASSKEKGKGKITAPVKHDEDEELFDFEDAATGSGSSKAEKYLPEEQDEEEPPAAAAAPARQAPSNLYSTSPAISIPHKAEPISPTTAGAGGGSIKQQFHDSIGSYKGGSLRMSVVRDSEITRAAAAMGDVKTYVGSVHGRTGIDPTDESSYRASFSNARITTGTTPRSLSERMMMEEAMEERARSREAKGQQQARGQT